MSFEDLKEHGGDAAVKAVSTPLRFWCYYFDLQGLDVGWQSATAGQDV